MDHGWARWIARLAGLDVMLSCSGAAATHLLLLTLARQDCYGGWPQVAW